MINGSNKTEAPASPKMKIVMTSPDDEILLTELAFDSKNLVAYEISSIIMVAQEEQVNPYGTFRGFIDPTTKEFFIEIPNEGTMHAFNKSALISTMDLAEEVGAETIFICVRNTVKRQEDYLKTFLFVGFEKLTEKEQKKISMTKTHGILKCSLNSEEENEG
jgi:hypothetical protein